MKDKPITLVFDEYTDERGIVVIGTIVHVDGRNLCIDVQFVDGKGKQKGVCSVVFVVVRHAWHAHRGGAYRGGSSRVAQCGVHEDRS